MTQREFAKALAISPSSLSSIFNGHTSPTNYTVQAIHRIFPEISITWLMFGEGEMMSGGEATDNAGTADTDKPAGSKTDAQAETATPSTLPFAEQQTGAAAGMQIATGASGAQQVVIRETVKYLDKPQRRITEIHVFYDDGTFETFSGKRES